MHKYIPISKPTIGSAELRAVNRVLRSGMLATGPVTAEFEKQFAAFCGTRYAVAACNGTAALHVALHVTIQPGDEVITTPFTFVATVNAILMAGGVPVFVDIDEKTYNIDATQIEKAITKKTKALLPVNLYGQPADYDIINALAKRYKLHVIEDAAQSVGAQYHDKISGILADSACFSLYATKNIMCGEGGIVTTNNTTLYERMKEFRNHGQPAGKRYEYSGLGYNYRLTDIHAAIALEQLKRFQTFNKKRQQIAKKYSDAFGAIKGIQIPYTAPRTTHVYHQYTLRITEPFPLKRDQLQQYLLSKGIQTGIYYPLPLFDIPHIKTLLKKKRYPVTETVVQQVVSLPIYPTLSRKEVNHIIATILSLQKRN